MRRKRSRRVVAVIAIAVIIGMVMVFSYFGVEAAKNVDVSLQDSTVLSKDDHHTIYDVTVQFRNTSIIPLIVGDTIYNINVDGDVLGRGMIKSFMIGSYDTILVNSEFKANNIVLDRFSDDIGFEETYLIGTTNYDLYFTVFDVSFNHNPTEDQLKKFVYK